MTKGDLEAPCGECLVYDVHVAVEAYAVAAGDDVDFGGHNT